ncbi:MAG: hypothetical protein ACYCWW_15310 [Deltaproteobacteria bacterium]
MADASGGGVGSALRGAFMTLVVLGLLGVVGWLLSERNAHHYFLHADGGTVLVERGFMLPYGHGAYRPKDPALAPAYAPLRLPPGVAPPADEELEERADLDRRLGELLIASARVRIDAKDPSHLAEGIGYLDRAELLPELGSDQRETLRALRSEVAYFEASDKIARALGALQEARALLRLGSEGSQSHARESADLLDRMSTPLDGLLRAARAAAILPAERPELPLAPGEPPPLEGSPPPDGGSTRGPRPPATDAGPPVPSPQIP